MTRPKGLSKKAMVIQEDLDCITSALLGWDICEEFLRLRIEQANQRTGLNELLLPALDELDEMSRRMAAAKSHVSRALTRLTE